jgi:predicted nuclease of predicted toxin-antitoxin system
VIRLLLDEHISPSMVERFGEEGVYAQSVPHAGLSGQPDPDIWRHALDYDFTVVTTNARDFIKLLNVEVHPGLIVLREAA